MKTTIRLLTVLFLLFCGTLNAQDSLQGKWVRMGHSGPVALEFKPNGTAEVDFGNDQSTDVVTDYGIDKNTIRFSDKEGAMCPEPGEYTFDKTYYYVAFDLVDDMCNGRIQMTMGYWTKPNFEELLGALGQKISETQNPELNLARARIYLATGKAQKAKADLDVYLAQNPNDARAFINRAATRFPADMKGAVDDCSRAITLDPENKNAYFLRGLARYELGEKEKACQDFSRAIELGFSILRIAEEQRCEEFWNSSGK